MGVVVGVAGHALPHHVQRCQSSVLGFTTSFYTESTEYFQSLHLEFCHNIIMTRYEKEGYPLNPPGSGPELTAKYMYNIHPHIIIIIILLAKTEIFSWQNNPSISCHFCVLSFS